MTKEVKRSYLEINSLHELKESPQLSKDYSLDLCEPNDFQLNKFFYKNIGKKHRWNDRLIWTDSEWITYVEEKKVDTFILKKENDMAGYFELIYHEGTNEIEIAYLGLLEEYLYKKLGSFLLHTALKQSFLKKPKRVWVHTCSLDHKNALNNYLSRGMKVFKEETLYLN